MKKQMNLWLGLLAAGIMIPCLSAQAQYTGTFYGYDNGNGDGNANITSWPNSDAAAGQFLGHLIGTGTETFESFAVGQSAPLAINFTGAGTATLNPSGSIVDFGSTGVGRFNITPGGSKFFETSSQFSINFSLPSHRNWKEKVGSFQRTCHTAGK